MEDTCGIHEEYMRNTCISNVSGEVRISDAQDTCGIHAGYMYPQRSSRYMRDTCGIHAGYMRDTCILSGNQDTIEIHSGYIQDTCEIHAGYMRETCLRGLGECMDAIMESSAPIRPPMSSLCRNGSAPAPSRALSRAGPERRGLRQL